MKIQGDGQMLRVFLDEDDTWEGKPLYQEIVRIARNNGLAGATVLRGVMGFGANSLIHAVRNGIADTLPVVVEIIDQDDKIKKFIPILDRMVKEGLVTLEKVQIVAYRTSKV